MYGDHPRYYYILRYIVGSYNMHMYDPAKTI